MRESQLAEVLLPGTQPAVQLGEQQSDELLVVGRAELVEMLEVQNDNFSPVRLQPGAQCVQY